MTVLAYRPDIDGLRAVAVGTVVLFHAHLGIFPGGFIGVDVFFVISGYLITSIVARELDAGSFSLFSFYERRIRRIFPALLVVVATCLAVGAWRLTPRSYDRLGETALAAIGFHSNFYFADKAGYFMPAAETVPLLHTWSLGVEEQFYVVAPLLLLALWRYRSSVAPVLAVLMAVAFAVSVWGTASDSERAFYLPHTRAIELMIGMALGIGLVPAVRSRPARQFLSALGLLMVLASASLFTSAMPLFPGAAALVPCLGSALIIHCAGGDQGTSLVGRLLSTAPSVWIGKISYSLYLWHWPLFAFAAYEWGEVGVAVRLGLVVASIALAAVTYRWIEQPARTSRLVLTPSRVFAAGLGSASILAAFAGVVVATKGLPVRLPPEVAAIEHNAIDGGQRRSLCGANMRGKLNKPCPLGRADVEPTVLAWGDSHAWMLAPMLDAVGRDLGIGINLVTRSGCPGLLDSGQHGLGKKKCASAFQSQIDESLKRGTIKHVILVSRWQTSAAGPALSEQVIAKDSISEVKMLQRLNALESSFLRTIAHFLDLDLRVTVLGPMPDLPVHLPTAMTKAKMRGQEFALNYDLQDFNARHAAVLRLMRIAEAKSRVDVIYPAQILCPAESCRFWENDAPFYRDDDHLSERGSGEIKPSLTRSLSWLRQPFATTGLPTVK